MNMNEIFYNINFKDLNSFKNYTNKCILKSNENIKKLEKETSYINFINILSNDITLSSNINSLINLLINVSNDKKIMALLYRMDIKTLAAIEDKKNLVNDAVLNSVLRKIWIDKNTGTIIKLSFMYNGISYIINKNEN